MIFLVFFSKIFVPRSEGPPLNSTNKAELGNKFVIKMSEHTCFAGVCFSLFYLTMDNFLSVKISAKEEIIEKSLLLSQCYQKISISFKEWPDEVRSKP